MHWAADIQAANALILAFHRAWQPFNPSIPQLLTLQQRRTGASLSQQSDFSRTIEQLNAGRFTLGAATDSGIASAGAAAAGDEEKESACGSNSSSSISSASSLSALMKSYDPREVRPSSLHSLIKQLVARIELLSSASSSADNLALSELLQLKNVHDELSLQHSLQSKELSRVSAKLQSLTEENSERMRVDQEARTYITQLEAHVERQDKALSKLRDEKAQLDKAFAMPNISAITFDEHGHLELDKIVIKKEKEEQKDAGKASAPSSASSPLSPAQLKHDTAQKRRDSLLGPPPEPKHDACCSIQ